MRKNVQFLPKFFIALVAAISLSGCAPLTLIGLGLVGSDSESSGEETSSGFLGARERARDRATQSDLRNALTAAMTGFADEQIYPDSLSLKKIEPGLEFVSGPGTKSAVGVITLPPDSDAPVAICLSKISDTGKIFKIYSSIEYGHFYTARAEDACPIGDTQPGGSWDKGGFPS